MKENVQQYKLYLDAVEKEAPEGFLLIPSVEQFKKTITHYYTEEKRFPTVLSISILMGESFEDFIANNILGNEVSGVAAVNFVIGFCKHYKIKLPVFLFHNNNEDVYSTTGLKNLINNTKTNYDL